MHVYVYIHTNIKADTLNFMLNKPPAGSVHLPQPCSTWPWGASSTLRFAAQAQDSTSQALLGGAMPGKGQAECALMLKVFSLKLTDQFFHPLRCFWLKTVI